MANKNLTAANAVVAISVPNLYPVPQVLTSFVADNPFSADEQVIAETVLSLNGRLSGGWIPSTIMQTFTILPDTDDMGFFLNWMQASQSSRSMFECAGVITLPSIKRVYTMPKGFLISGKVFPDVSKILQPISFKIQWQFPTSAELP